MAMIDMTMSKAEAKEQNEPQTADDGPRYPWGLSLTLDDDSMKKLGVGDDLKIGDEVTLTAKAMVTNKSGYQTMVGDSESSVGLQITAMEIGGDGGNAVTKILYGKK